MSNDLHRIANADGDLTIRRAVLFYRGRFGRSAAWLALAFFSRFNFPETSRVETPLNEFLVSVISKPRHQSTIDEGMKVLLQNKRTLLYFKRPEDWTASIEEASDFMHSERAINFAREQLLAGVRLVVAFRESGHFQILPFKTRIRLPHVAGFHPIPSADLS